MPNGLSDGAVIIDTGLNNSKFFTDAKAFRAAAQGLKQTVNRVGAEMGKSGGAYLRSIQTNMRANREFRDQLAALEKQAKAMRDAIDQPGTGSKAYKAVEAEIKQVEAQFDKAIEKRDTLVGDNGQVAASNAGQYRHWSAEVERLAGKLEELETKQQAIANPTGDDIAQYQQRVNAYNQVAVKLEEMRKVANTAGGGFSVLARNVGAAVAAVARIAGSGALAFLRKLAAGAKNAAIQFAKLAGRAVANAAKSLLHLGRGARQSGRGFQFSLKNMLKYGLGIRSLFVLFNRLRSAIKEGFGELANYDPRVKAALGSLKASLGGLKGSLSAAFAPILTAVAPALTTLIDLLTRAVNAVGMFFAAITGQGYYTAAKGIQAIDGAASSASGSAKDLKRQLAGFDELNILSAPGGGGGGSGSSGGGTNYTFEKTPIAAGIQNFADQLKALVAAENWDGLGALFADKINGAFEKANKLISWDNLGGKITQIIDAVAGTFNSLVAKIKWEKIGETFATGANTIIKTGTEILTKFDFPALAASLTRGLNNFISHVEWRDLGRLIAKYVGTIIASLKSAITTFSWDDTATAFADAINGFFEDEKLWEDAGETVNRAIQGLLTFGQTFIAKFDEKQAANDVKAALKKIDWEGIVRGAWEFLRTAVLKVGSFINVLFGDDGNNGFFAGLKETLSGSNGFFASLKELGNGDSIGGTIGKALSNVAEGLLDAITWAIDRIDWTEIGDQLHEAILAIEWDDVIVKIVNAIVSAVQGLNDFFGALIFGKENWKNIKGAKEEAETTTNTALRTVVDKVADTIGLEMDKDQRQGASNMLQDLGIVALFGAPGSIYTGFRNLGRVFGGANAEEASLIDDREVIDSLDKNTRATEKDTRTREEKLAANVVDGIVGGTGRGKDRALTNALGAALWGETPDADVKVNFIPQGMSPAFVNKPLAGLQSAFAPGADVTGRVNLTRNNFATVAGFVQGYMGGAVDKGVGLFRSAWSTVQGFVNGFQGGAVNKPIDLTRSSAWSSVQGFVGGFMGGSVYKPIDLTRSWWSTVQNYVLDFAGGNVGQKVDLIRHGWENVGNWAKNYAGAAIEQKVVLKITDVTASSGVTGARIAINKAMGGIITAGGRSLSFASGGYLSGSRANWWNSARKYASGTSRAHGTLFVAGEAGPEIVGHVGGRTEVLNRSQLAQTMYSAVTSGMISALRGITFTMPAMATGGIMPYEVSAQIAKSTAEINSTLNANNEDLIQTIISVAGQIVAALNRQNSPQPAGAGSLTAQQVINEINRQTLMFGASPLKGV